MDLKEIYSIFERFENSSIYEMELEHHGLKLSLRKGNCSYVEDANATHKVVNINNSNVDVKKESEEVTNEANDANIVSINAPLVGTFYRAKSPESEPFVQVGDKVSKGDVLGLVEAMKMMNEITASEDGIVSEILAKNGELVSFNQCLMKIKI